MSTRDNTTQVNQLTQLGFRDMHELNALVVMVPLNSAEAVSAFEQWKQHDGTKDGLLHLLGIIKRPDNTYEFHNYQVRDKWHDHLRDRRIREFSIQKKDLEAELMEDLRQIEQQRVSAPIVFPQEK